MVVGIGFTSERLVAVSKPFKVPGNRKYFIEVECSRGNRKVVQEYHLRTRAIKSCGCLRSEITSRLNLHHGKSGTTESTIWRNMKQRCCNSGRDDYADYGGRGITVCDRWLEPDGKGFLNFLSDMGERPKGMTLDRIDVDGNYEPSNCRWAERSTQNHNKRKTNSGEPTSCYMGVSKAHGDKWTCKISKNGKAHVSRFSSEYEAAYEYDNLSEEMYGNRPNGTKKRK